MKPRDLVCAYNIYEKCLKNYPKRNVKADVHCEHYHFYYLGFDGKVRQVKTNDNSIWVCDYDRGFPYMRRVRPKGDKINWELFWDNYDEKCAEYWEKNEDFIPREELTKIMQELIEKQLKD